MLLITDLHLSLVLCQAADGPGAAASAWVWWIVSAIAAVALGAAVWRFLRRRRLLRQADAELDPFAPPAHPTEQDLAAVKLIEAYRRRVWRRLSISSGANYRAILQTLTDLVLAIAAVYNQGRERPELGVTPVGLIHLARRITERLEGLLETGPGRTVSGIAIGKFVGYYSFFDRIQQKEPFKTLVSRPAVRKTLSWGWWLVSTVRNWSDPYVWAYRGVKTAAWETSARVLLVQLIEFTGMEAMATFSGRPPPVTDSRQEEWALREAFYIASLARPLQAGSLRALLKAVFDAKTLSQDRRLKLIATLAQDRIPPADVPADLLLSPQFCKRLLDRAEWAADLQAGGEHAKMERLQHWEQLTRRGSRRREALAAQIGQNGIRPEEARERNRAVQQAAFILEAAALQRPGGPPDYTRFTPEMHSELTARGANFPGAPFSEQDMEALFSASEDGDLVWRAAAAIEATSDRRDLLNRIIGVYLSALPLRVEEDDWLRELLARWNWNEGRAVYEARLRTAVPLAPGASPPDLAFVRYLLSSAEPGERFAGALETASQQTVTDAGQQFTGPLWLAVTDRRLCLTGYGASESGGIRLFDIRTVPDDGRVVLAKRGRFRRPWRYRIDAAAGPFAEFLIPNARRPEFTAMVRHWHSGMFDPGLLLPPALLLPLDGSGPQAPADGGGESG